jgi:hypothetical protein
LVILDHVHCERWWCEEPTRTWTQFLEFGIIHQVQCYQSEDRSEGFCWGQFMRSPENDGTRFEPIHDLKSYFPSKSNH